ncbi:efflux RND transporter periplasmic adaptor subunit [Alteromonas sediminis]|uniref:Efflux RND transporter periplasmic adaptor subunit n=2 Tax=Alteromonas sediminis TaxID=2259342 RepID=A0A3N5XXF7_9ALTE|nr:efflux RND transporter periplasmic adaptor subunit [Alteromonas sediminis]
MYSALAQGQSRGNERPANVVVQPLTFSPITLSIETVGSAEAFRSVSLYAAVGDRVEQVYFTPGQRVSKGDVLVALDARRQEIAVKRAEIELADKERTLKRVKNSLKKDAVTQSQLDDALTQRDLALVALEEAIANLEDRRVVAPFDGIVGLTNVEPGDRIDTNTLITTLDDRQTLFVNFDAPESALSMLEIDNPVELQPWNNRDISLNAVIKEMDSRVNLDDRTIRVRALLDNDADLFRPGLSFRVTLTLEGESYPMIPEAALSWGATSAHVWVEREQKAAREAVTIKQRRRGYILVEGNISEQDNLIIEGIQQLRAGQAVSTSTMMSQVR